MFDFIWGLVMGLLLGFLVGLCLLDVFKEEAVVEGHAYWKVQTNGSTNFVWKDECGYEN